MRRIYTEVKAAKPAVKIIMSPSVYPFALNEYLQDWPTWVESGWVDGIIPQLYRYDIAAYRATVQSQKNIFQIESQSLYAGCVIKKRNLSPLRPVFNRHDPGQP